MDRDFRLLQLGQGRYRYLDVEAPVAEVLVAPSMVEELAHQSQTV
jgi:hypothetical protein